jgi:phosphatidylinositol alpha-1,6-mannosyltransferase
MNARALAVARRVRPEIVLSGHVVATPAALLIARRFGARLVTYLHADEVPAHPWLSRAACTRSDALVAVSAYTKGLALEHGAEPERVHVVPPGVSLPAVGRREEFARPTVLTVSRLADPYKGHDVMLAAIAQVRVGVPDVEWLVAGDGPLRADLERRSAALGLTGTVRFLGAVADGERDELFDRAHVFAMPSRLPPSGTGGEGFGIVYLEAAARGLPSVAGNVAGAPDAVVDGQTGLLVDPSSVTAVADAIATLLRDDGLRRDLGAAARRRAESFAWPAIASRVDRVLRGQVSRTVR